jgi:hypothetical protein
MSKLLSILAVLLLLYFIISQPVTAANAAGNLGSALASAADSLVTFTNSLLGDATDGTSGTSADGTSGDGESSGSGDGESDSWSGEPRPVPTSAPAGVPASGNG